MKRDLGPTQHPQPFVLSPVQASQQPTSFMTLVPEPFQLAHLFGSFRHPLSQQPLGMNRHAGMIEDAELSSIVGHGHPFAHQPMMAPHAPEVTFCGIRHRPETIQ